MATKAFICTSMKFINRNVFLFLALTTVCATTFAEQRWVDVTSDYFCNPSFESQDKSDWTFDGQSDAFARISNGCIEMWQGWMSASTHLHLPNGHYRFSVQAFFRFRRNAWAYPQYLDGTEEHSAYLSVNGQTQDIKSVYTFAYDVPTSDCYQPEGEDLWFPNAMSSAEKAFNEGAYPNSMEFEVTNGQLEISIYNDVNLTHTDNWLIFDQVMLERLTEVNVPQEGDLFVNELVAATVDLQFSPAYNFDGWIELYNASDKELTLAGCYLSDDVSNLTKWCMPTSVGQVPAHGFKQLWMGSNDIRSNQAPFKLDCQGGTIYISNPSGTLLLSQDYPAAISRTAYARTTDGGETWNWTATPTPAATNVGVLYSNVRTNAPIVVQDGQLFDSSLRIVVKKAQGSTLRYTTDGTTPSLSNGLTSDNGIFNISESTTFRFCCFKDGELPSPIVTRSYLKRDRDYKLPIIIINTPDEYLYDDYVGVYVRGVNGRTGNGQSSPVNWNMNWDRPVNFQYILPESNTMAINQDVDFSISGGWTRSSSVKSFKLKADRVYEDQNFMPYMFFDAKPYNRNKTLQVRYGGNDTGCRIKDAALHTIIQRSGIDLDVMSYQPAVHFINGDYKGLINVREPNNKDFAFANWGLSKDELEVFEQSPDSGFYMMLGTSDVFDRLYELSMEANQPEAYAEICDILDIDEYINYMAAELYLGSWDWPDNNIKGYRAKDGGRFRLTFFDLDAAFGTDGRGMDEEGEINVGGNTFRWIDGMQWHRYDYIYDTGERRYGEIKFCTIFLNLLENDSFRRRFMDTFCLMGSVFEPTRANAILDELGERVRETMSWEWSSPDGSLNEIRNKLKGRAADMTKQMKAYERFRLSEVQPQKVHLSMSSVNGNIYVNGVHVPYGEYSGELFPPVKLSAQPIGGYRFVGWRYANQTSQYITTDSELDLPEGDNLDLVAEFRKMTGRERKGYPDIRINEVSAANNIFVNDNFKRNDWIELYNTTSKDIDLTGMFLTDDATNLQKYAITGGSNNVSTIIPAYGRRIVWCDKKEGASQLHADFKLATEGGMVAISAADASWTDTFYYPEHTSSQTVGRYPDGSDNTFVMNIPTIDQSNILTSYLTIVDQQALDVNDVLTSSQVLTIRYAAGRLSVRSNGVESVTFRVFTLDGCEVMLRSLTLAGGYAEVDCHQLPAGAYMAHAYDNDGHTKTIKFLR